MEFLKGFLLFSELLSELVADFLFFLGLLWLLIEIFLNLHALEGKRDTAEFIRKYRLMMFVGIPLILVVGTQADHIALLTLINTGNFTGTPPYAIFAVILFVGLLLFLGHLVWKAGQPVHSLWITSGFLVIMIAMIILVNRSPKKIAYPFPNHTPTTSQVAAVHTSTPTPTATSTATATPTPTATSTPTITPTPTSTPTETPDPGVLHYICEFHSIQITSPEDEHRIPQESRTKNIEGTYSQDTSGKRFVLISMDTRAGVERYWAESIVMFGTQKWTAKVHLHKGWDRPEQEIRLAVGVYYDKDNITSGIYFDGANQVPNDVVKDLVQCGSSITLIVQRSR